MKGLYLNSIFIIILFCSLSISAVAQLQINTGATPEEMVEELVGVGIEYFNVSYEGAEVAGGIFTLGGSAGLGVEHGIFLCSGNGHLIPGPNSSYSAGENHGLDGHPFLTDILGVETYDAVVLEFDFKPLHDTLQFKFIFGSEEYNEYVGAPFNDIYGLFVSGPNPAGGFYENRNFAALPDEATGLLDTIPVYINNVNNGPAAPGEPSSGPCNNCDYYFDNVNGTKNIEYDGITTTINSIVPVQQAAFYHFIIVIADAGDAIFDSGVLLEGKSFKSLGPAQFNSFSFLAANNDGLTTDVIGQIVDSDVYLTVPDGVDVSKLVANFQVGGVYVDVDGIAQISGVTQNNFLEPLTYHLEGYNTKDWQVFVETATGIKQYLFNRVKIGPNPSHGEIRFDNVSGFDVRILDSVGRTVQSHKSVNNNTLSVKNLYPGIYFVQLKKEGRIEVRKIIVQ